MQFMECDKRQIKLNIQMQIQSGERMKKQV